MKITNIKIRKNIDRLLNILRKRSQFCMAGFSKKACPRITMFLGFQINKEIDTRRERERKRESERERERKRKTMRIVPKTEAIRSSVFLQ